MNVLKYITISFIMSSGLVNAVEKHEGVMFDENGLTIQLGKPVIVDTKRWNLNKDTYYLAKASEDEKEVKIKVHLDSNEKVKSFSKYGYGEAEDGEYGNNVILLKREQKYTDAEGFVVSTALCNELDKKKFFELKEKCTNLTGTLAEIYNADLVKSEVISDVAKLKNINHDEAKEYLEDQKIEYSKKNRKVEEKLEYLVDVIAKKCSGLKKYSVKEVDEPISSKAASEKAIAK